MKSKEIRKFRETYTKYEKNCVFEGYKLAVLFDEKDHVKKMGGRWHPYPNQDGGYWWMPESKLTDEANPDGTNVRDWLNDNQMIMGQQVKFNETEHTVNLFSGDEDDHYTEYGLHKSNNEPQYKVQFFYDQDVAKFIPTGMGDLATEYLTIEDGRKRWDEFINTGYNRVENS